MHRIKHIGLAYTIRAHYAVDRGAKLHRKVFVIFEIVERKALEREHHFSNFSIS
jgi:hypothetical protein